jgi:hypothetical protein
MASAGKFSLQAAGRAAALTGAVRTLDTLLIGGLSIFAALAPSAIRAIGLSVDTFFSVGSGPAVGPHSEVSKLSGANHQAHHVNQNVIYGNKIP